MSRPGPSRADPCGAQPLGCRELAAPAQSVAGSLKCAVATHSPPSSADGNHGGDETLDSSSFILAYADIATSRK